MINKTNHLTNKICGETKMSKKMSQKKISLIVLCVVLLIAAIVAAVLIINYFNKNKVIDGVKYTLSQDKTYFSVTGVTSDAGSEITISSECDGLPVERIAGSAFYQNSTLSKVNIPESIKSIGANAFNSCTALKEITIPNNVKSVGSFAFAACTKLSKVVIGDGVAYLGYAVFSGCTNLATISISDSIKFVGDYAFENCDKLSYNIKNNVNYVGDSNNKYVIAVGVTKTTISAINLEETCKIISYKAFYGCDLLTSLIIPDGVIQICGSALPSELKYLSIPNSVNILSVGALGIANKLEYKVKDNVKYIGNTSNPYLVCMGVNNTSDKVTSLAEGCKIIYNSIFKGNEELEEVIIPEGITSIGYAAFKGCTNLTSITIPEGVQYIGYEAFSNCSNITEINLPSTIVSLGGYAFDGNENRIQISYNGTMQEWTFISGLEAYGFSLTYRQGLLKYDLLCTNGTMSSEYYGTWQNSN
jgi:hypothetical protein